MKIAKGKTTAIGFALILILAMVISLFAFPTANAQFGPTIESMTAYAFIGARPNPVGVGQQVLLHFGITESTQISTDGFVDITITVEKPDGDTDTLGPFETDSTGGSGTVFTPDMAGEYVLQTHFPEQWYNYSGFNVFGMPVDTRTLYEASDSDELTLVVQEEEIPYYPGVPLPTEYWTRPIDAQSREWYTISGSWLYTPSNRVALYNDGPETAHILWTKPLTMGGLVGGDIGLTESINQGAVGFATGDAYEGIWSSRFILAGRLYYAEYSAGMLSSGVFPEPITYHCVDLHTGEELWAKTFLDNQTISFAQLLYYQGFNYMGSFAYLYVVPGGGGIFGPTGPVDWYAFNAYTGNLAFTVLNVPTGTTLRDGKGGLYVLHVDTANAWMGLWNLSQFVESSGTGYYAEGGSWGNIVNGQTFDAGADTTAAKEAWSWNETITSGLPGSVQTAFFGDRVIGSNLAGGFFGGGLPNPVTVWGLSLKDGEEGRTLFNEDWSPPSHWISGNESISWAAWSGESEVGVLWSKELRQHYGVSLETGELDWGPTPSQYYLDIYEGTQLTSHLIAYGKLYACGVAGILYCYNATTGELLWTYEAKDPYTESQFASNWWLGIPFITDGKVYLGSAEHSANQPLPRGAPFICLDAETGDLIWRVNGLFRQTGWGGLAIIGDSIMATMDTYDQRVYAVGKGPSSTTVSAPDVGVPFGSTVMIKGAVIDVSPGTTSTDLTLRFPNGVPAVSDESMSDWMLYVYKQFELPANAMGVEVVLSVLDSNGNFYEIGRTNSSANGYYSFAYTPEIPGIFNVYASFEGSGAYYGSRAETSFVVEPAPEPTVAPTPTPAPMTDTIVTGFGIGMIIAIVAVGLVLILMLRKR